MITLPSSIEVVVADLPPGQLGEAYQGSITLDTNASGRGWFVEGAKSNLAGQYDLLTVISHEIGHLLGYEHSHSDSDVMASILPTGVRRLPLASGSDTSYRDLLGGFGAVSVIGRGLPESTLFDPPFRSVAISDGDGPAGGSDDASKEVEFLGHAQAMIFLTDDFVRPANRPRSVFANHDGEQDPDGNHHRIAIDDELLDLLVDASFGK